MMHSKIDKTQKSKNLHNFYISIVVLCMLQFTIWIASSFFFLEEAKRRVQVIWHFEEANSPAQYFPASVFNK